jgi:hypothetical protein
MSTEDFFNLNTLTLYNKKSPVKPEDFLFLILMFFKQI